MYSETIRKAIFGTLSSVPCREIISISQRVHYRRFHCKYNFYTADRRSQVSNAAKQIIIISMADTDTGIDHCQRKVGYPFYRIGSRLYILLWPWK